MKETVVTIGANHGGTVVLNTILDQFLGNQVVAPGRNPDINFLGCGTALWTGGQISGPEGLFYSSKEAFKEEGVVIHMETEVERIDFDGKAVYTRGKGGKSYVQEYGKLILTTGFVPLRPKIEGMELDNVQSVKLCQNVRDVTEKLRDTSVEKVTVVDVEYIGVELAEAFKRNGREVVLTDLADTCLSGYCGGGLSGGVAHNLQERGMKLAFGEKVVKPKGKERVERVVTDQGCYEANVMVFGIGFRPNTSLGQGRPRILGNRTFLVDRRQGTSVPGVHAVGDCATVYNSTIQTANYIALATNVVCSGIVAAHNACGKVLESVGVQGFSGISIWGLCMLGTGISLARAKWMGYDVAAADYGDWQEAEFMENGNHKAKTHIVYDRKSRIILGTQACSGCDVSMGIHMFSMAVEEQVTIDKLKLSDLSFLPHSSKPYNYVTMAALRTEQD